MKKTLVLTTIALLVSGSAAAKTWVLTNAEEGMDKGNWQINSDQLKVKDHAFSIEQKVLHGGKQEGSKILTIHSKDGLTITLSPTRGMNLLRIEGFGSRMGWDSPVKEVVNPAFINLESRNGLGWLEGFNEMMVRCGYEWTGHPVTADGQIYTLHGKAGNTPASLVEVEVADSAPYEIRIRGLVKESTFKKADLQTLTELRYVPGSNSFSLHDVLTNHADYPHDYQIIYHSNFGTPILEEGARFLAPMSSISPFNDYAKSGLKTWQTYQASVLNDANTYLEFLHSHLLRISPEKNYNSFATCFFQFYCDGGIIGIVLLSFLYGYYAQHIFEKMVILKSKRAESAYVFFFANILMLSFVNMETVLALNFWPLVLVKFLYPNFNRLNALK